MKLLNLLKHSQPKTIESWHPERLSTKGSTDVGLATYLYLFDIAVSNQSVVILAVLGHAPLICVKSGILKIE